MIIIIGSGWVPEPHTVILATQEAEVRVITD
jgi:hypothetical protein